MLEGNLAFERIEERREESDVHFGIKSFLIAFYLLDLIYIVYILIQNWVKPKFNKTLKRLIQYDCTFQVYVYPCLIMHSLLGLNL